MLLLLTFSTRSSSSTPWLWPLVGACAGIYLFYQGFRLLLRKRLIMNTPVSKVRSAAMGLVEVSGLASGPYTMNAPITGLPCFYYRTMVWQWKQRGKNSSWVKEADESLHLPFFLEDNTGRLLVDPQGAEMDIHRDFHDEFSNSVFSSNLAIPGNITSFLLMHGISTDKKIKVEEYCIKPKNALFVLGTLAQNTGITVSGVPVRTAASGQHSLSLNIGASLATSTPFLENNTLLQPGVDAGPARALNSAEQENISAALMKAGIANPAAWAAAGISRGAPTTSAVTGGAGSAAAAPALQPFDLHPPTVLMKGAHEPAFFISWRSQRDVVKSLGWKSALMIWGGPALTLLCLYILAAEFGWW
jgi:hypothetical protein